MENTTKNPIEVLDFTTLPGYENIGREEGVIIDGKEQPVVSPTVSVEKPVLTKKQIGQLRRQYVTINHGRVIACGHRARFGAFTPPKNNCVSCWTAFWHTAANLEDVHRLLTEKGVRALVAKHGMKYTKMFHGWLKTVLTKESNDRG